MRKQLLDVLRCPTSGQPLLLRDAVFVSDRAESGWLVTADERYRYAIRNFIPRFVPESNYADNFGMQWNLFRQTQLDSHSGHAISAQRFWSATGWTPEQLRDRWVLDAGCGAGRFAEVALEAGAHVVALDYSSAVDACFANLRHHSRLHLIQGDIYRLPVANGRFDLVYSLGVLQHTPDVSLAVASLPPKLAPGGRVCVDFYERSWRTPFVPYYWLRPITKRVPKAKLFGFLQKAVPKALPVSRGIGRIPVIGRQLRRVVPVANYEGELPLSPSQHLEWSLLDTFDWLAPEYDNPQTLATVREWLSTAGLVEVEVMKLGHLVGRGTAVAS